MRYELIANSDVGVIIDPTPILRDIKDTFAVSFVLPDAGVYIALFRDEVGVEYRATIADGAAKVPKQLLAKEQRIGLTVCKIYDDKILHSWVCQTLKVGTFLSLRKTQWQITAGVDDKELYARLAEIERANAKERAEYEALLAAFETLQAEFDSYKEASAQAEREHAERHSELTKALASVIEANQTLATKYNEAIETINSHSGRITALEKNYDPTVIG
ncbi:hypothetical protein [Anaerocaecibacter muris]|uniref:hypothetical protein n=1 Tax=Anaerocaecibacter muris TaxID=2941513 RepID=UPI002040BE71|nr:hypothetical protein [Anaerocaecibacter muris]